MSHYPSSAELASFRRSIDPHIAYEHPESRGPIIGVRDGVPYSFGAWPEERENGIGRERKYDGIGIRSVGLYYTSHVASYSRRMVNRKRSRAFSRIFGTDTTWPEITEFVPDINPPWPHRSA